eukprot:14933349-Heterocapsa_arctica.AAC.1
MACPALSGGMPRISPFYPFGAKAFCQTQGMLCLPLPSWTSWYGKSTLPQALSMALLKVMVRLSMAKSPGWPDVVGVLS